MFTTKERNEATAIGTKWIAKISTGFNKDNKFNKTFIENWIKLINFNLITFIIYEMPHISIEAQNGYNIHCYLELKRNCRSNYLKNLLGFSNHIVYLEKVNGKSKILISSFILNYSKSNKELFWNGVPRFEKRILNSLNYEFIIKHDLFDKARRSISHYFREKSNLNSNDNSTIY